MSSAAAALALALSLGRNVSHPTLRRLERFDTLVLLVELGLALSTRRHSGRVIGRPLREGHLGRLFNWGVLGAGIGVPIVLQSPAAWGRGHVSRAATIAASLFVLAGGLTLRYVMVMAGHISGDDPAATFEYTRGDEPATTYTGTPETMASLALNDASAEGEATNTREGQQ
jgi:formate-dependent nitrite reductase membrane component NrfD